MVNKKQAIQILNDLVAEFLVNENWYKDTHRHIKATLLHGSVSKGTNRPDSDIDMLIILPLEVEEKYTKSEYSYNYQDQQINIVLRSIEKLRIIAGEQKDKFQKEVFSKSVLIYEKDNEVKKLLTKIAQI
jgi:predicted nucleotidyltransferase